MKNGRMWEESGWNLGEIWEGSVRKKDSIWEACGKVEAEEASGRHLEGRSQKT